MEFDHRESAPLRMGYTYDGVDRLTQATYNSLSGSPYEQFNYDYLGNRGGNSAGGDVGYTDTRPGGVSIEYAENNPANEYSLINSSGVEYDQAGNLTKDEDGFFMAYDGDSQLAAVYADSNGDGDYDAGTDDVVAEYAYDALGRRIQFVNHFDGSGIYCSSTPCTVTTRFVHDGQNIVAEYDASATPDRQRYYVHGASYIDERAVMRDEVGAIGRDFYYLLKDLYTVVGLANKQGHEVERYVYDAYGKATIVSTLTGDVNFNGEVNQNDRSVLIGAWTSGAGVCGTAGGPIFDLNADGLINATDRSVLVGQWSSPNNQNTVIPASGLGNPYSFTGRTLDVFKDAISGSPGTKPIYHYRARFYDPEHGRFLQRDPAEYKDGANLYEYVGSRPSREVDPSGLSCGGGMGSSRYMDRSKACCRYKRTTYSWGLGGDAFRTRRHQRTQFCKLGIDAPESCCDCSRRIRGDFGQLIEWKTLESAQWGKCCSCKVQVRQLRSWLGPFSHVIVIVECPGGSWSADHPPASADDFLPFGPAKKDLKDRYPLLLETLCVSCDTADAMRQRANELEGAEYGFVQDCAWYVRAVLGNRDEQIRSDNCEK